MLQQNPRRTDNLIWRFNLHLLAEENAAAKAIAGRVLERERLLGAPRAFLGELLRTEGDTAGAIREQQKVLETAPGNIMAIGFLARAYLDTGQREKARSLLEEKRSMFPGNYLWRHAWALLLAEEGKREEALQTMDEETLKFAAPMFLVTSQTADFYAVLGDTSKAVEWLDRAVRNGDERVEYFKRNPRFASIRQDPRFLRIIDSIEARRKR